MNAKLMNAKLEFEDLSFVKEENKVRVQFIKRFYFIVHNSELEEIARFEIKDDEKNCIYFDCKQSFAERRFQNLVMRKLRTELFASNGNKAVYVYDAPLIGAQRFGILDFDTNCIEIRPITGCNLFCNYCSVSEGPKTNKTEYVVDKDLIIREFLGLAAKKKNDLYVHISAQGDPVLYPKLKELIKDLSKIKKVKIITIGTNGTLLSKKMVDELVEAGLNRMNISINALTPEIAREIAGTVYNVDHIKEIAEYAAGKIQVIIAPTLLHGVNDGEMGKIIEFAKLIGAKVGIQNFLNYKDGRNSVKEWSTGEFVTFMKGLEEKHGIKLLNPDFGFEIVKDKVLEKPFRKGSVVSVEKLFKDYGRSGGRLIKVPDTDRRSFKVRLVKDKHNLYVGI